MDIQIKFHHMSKAKSLIEYIKHRLNLDLDRFERRIRRIVMHVYDTNGPRGGIDKRCLALVDLKPRGSVALELIDADPYTAVDRISDRLKEQIHRNLDKRRSKRRVETIWRNKAS